MRAVSLEEILQNREERVKRQEKVARRTNAALISFTMCIPGGIKSGLRISIAFGSGVRAVLDTLRKNGLKIVELDWAGGNTGPECLIAVRCDPVKLKKLTWVIEENHPCGRLFDLDVLDNRLNPISRGDIGKPERFCLICRQAAHICARERHHSLGELQQAVETYLMKAMV